MKKRLLKKAFKRAEAENRRLRGEVYHPTGIVRICICEHPGGMFVKDVMFEIDEFMAEHRNAIERSVRQGLDAWAQRHLDAVKKREAFLLAAMERQLGLSDRPPVPQAPLDALMEDNP